MPKNSKTAEKNQTKKNQTKKNLWSRIYFWKYKKFCGFFARIEPTISGFSEN